MDINIPESRVFGTPLNTQKKKFLMLREGTKYMSRILIFFYKIHFFKNSVFAAFYSGIWTGIKPEKTE